MAANRRRDRRRDADGRAERRIVRRDAAAGRAGTVHHGAVRGVSGRARLRDVDADSAVRAAGHCRRAGPYPRVGFRNVLRTTIRYAKVHPDQVDTPALLLWSINERMAGRTGVDVPMPNDDWKEELLELAALEAAEQEERDGNLSEQDIEDMLDG